MLECPMIARRRFQLVLIKPTHYDDDGYVIRWWRAMIPSNSLAAVYAIAADCAKRLVLGPDVAIDIEASPAAARAASGQAAALPRSVMKSHFSDGYLEIGSVLASVFGSVGRTSPER